MRGGEESGGKGEGGSGKMGFRVFFFFFKRIIIDILKFSFYTPSFLYLFRKKIHL